MQGKNLGECSSLMDEKWRDLSVEEKRTYEQKMEEVHVNETMHMGEFKPPKEKGYYDANSKTPPSSCKF